MKIVLGVFADRLSCAVIDRDLGDPQTHIFPESLPQDGFRTMQYAHIRPTGKRTAYRTTHTGVFMEYDSTTSTGVGDAWAQDAVADRASHHSRLCARAPARGSSRLLQEYRDQTTSGRHET